MAIIETSANSDFVVIDIADAGQMERLAKAWDDLADKSVEPGPVPMSLGAYRMQAALREFANPTPPKPEQPGKYGVVIAGDGREWVRYSTSEMAGRDWVRADASGGTVYARWDDLDVVRVVREGVAS